MPGDVAGYIRETYGVNLTARYLGYSLPHPIGKGSGQLSLNTDQLEADVAAGMAFVVLKTVIAEDAAGGRSMEAWAIHETRMRVEPRESRLGEPGWTVTWKGRGWDRSFDDYLALVRTGADLTRAGKMVVVPSAKLHLPRLDESSGKTSIATPSARSRAPGAMGRCRSKRTSHRRSPAMPSPTSGHGSCAGFARCRPGFAPRPAPFRYSLRSS